MTSLMSEVSIVPAIQVGRLDQIMKRLFSSDDDDLIDGQTYRVLNRS